MPCIATLHPAKPCHAVLCRVMPCFVMSCTMPQLCHMVQCHAMSCEMPCHTMLCHTVLYHAMISCTMPCRAVPGRVAVENQTTRSQAALRQQYEERQRESEHVYELLENKIQLLQEVSPGAVGVGGIQGLMPGGSPHCHAGGQAGTERGRAGHGAGQS